MTTKNIKLSSINDVKAFVNSASKNAFDTDLSLDRYSVDAKSIMGVLSLDLSENLLMTIHSDDCEEFLSEIEKFIVK